MQKLTLFQLTYAYSSCFWLLGVRQLAGNLHKYCCIFVKFLIFRRFLQFGKANLTLSYLSVYHSLSQRRIIWLPMDRIFEIYIRRILEYILKNVHLTRILCTLHEDVCKIMIARWILLSMRNITDRISRVNLTTHCMFYKCFPKSAVCEIKRKNLVKRVMPQMTIWHMRIACWITVATWTNSWYIILLAFSFQQWLCGLTAMLHTYLRTLLSC
jgi:hypothetical protein